MDELIFFLVLQEMISNQFSQSSDGNAETLGGLLLRVADSGARAAPPGLIVEHIGSLEPKRNKPNKQCNLDHTGSTITKRGKGAFIGRTGDPILRDNSRDVPVRSHVESRVLDGSSIRGHRHAGDVGDLRSRPLLNGDLVAGPERQIESRNWCGNVERNVIFFRQHRD